MEISGDFQPGNVQPSVAQIYADQAGIEDICRQLEGLSLPGDHTHNFSEYWGGHDLTLGPKHNPKAHYGHHLEFIFFGVGDINAEVETVRNDGPPEIVEVHLNTHGRDRLIGALLSLAPHKRRFAYATKSFAKLADGVWDGMAPLTYLEFCLVQ